MKLQIRRLLIGERLNIIKNILSSGLVFAVVAYAVRSDVCTTFEASKSAVFAYVMAAVWCGLFNTLCFFTVKSHFIMPQLKSHEYSAMTFLGATVIIQLVQCFIQALIGGAIFTVFGYKRERQVLWSINLDICVTLFLLILAADMLGLLISMFINTIQSALSVVPVILILQLLFCKGIFQVDEMLEPLTKFIEARHGIAALGSLLNVNSYPLAICGVYPEVQQVPNELFDYTGVYVVSCWRHLGVLILIPLLLSYITLMIKIYKKK